MNKLRMLILASFLAAGFVFAQGTNTVKSVNVVGYLKVNVASNYNQICFNWNGIGTNDVLIQDLFDPTTLKGGVDFFGGDNIFLWEAASQTYKQLYLYDGGGTPYDGIWYEYPSNLAATNTIQKGQAFWLRHKAAASASTISGEVPNAGSNTIGFVKGYTMFGSAYSASLDIGGQDWSGCAGGVDFFGGDNIFVWDAASQIYKQLYLYDGGGTPYDGLWYEYPSNIQYTDKIPLGQGAWFLHKPVGTATWTETKPYTL